MLRERLVWRTATRLPGNLHGVKGNATQPAHGELSCVAGAVASLRFATVSFAVTTARQPGLALDGIWCPLLPRWAAFYSLKRYNQPNFNSKRRR